MSEFPTRDRIEEVRRRSLDRNIKREYASLCKELEQAHLDISMLMEDGPVWLNRQLVSYDRRQILKRELYDDIIMKWGEVMYLEDQIAIALYDMKMGNPTTGIIGTDFS
ncbi:hypothetical protein PT974_01358 [Cladobotryum mycophilum]|uniref:Uncharacterized protein n=1 Tax=Cladobotryum mycophilum TaxID=491253 RepID=A0ABR0T423_9HYPO